MPAREAAHADLVAERLAERLAERDRDVLDGVVRVDVQVAGRPAIVRSNPPCLPTCSSMWS